MRPFGIILIIAALLTPLYWYVGWIAGPNGSAMFSQYIGSVSIITMGISMMLSTRIMGLEPIFGGLDRIYIVHKWLGILAVVTILIHDTVDAELQGRETFLTDLGETLGEVSLYGILILVVITIVTFIPYHLWLWTHKFMGLFFTFSAAHYIMLMKPLDPVTPLGIYMLVFCVLGVVSYVYTLLPLRGGRAYQVSSVQTLGSTTSLELKPVSRSISHRAGQFAFLDIIGAKKSEVHPFTISKAPDSDGVLRFTIKALGDYTYDIAKSVKVGQAANVSRAYGHFRRKNRGPEIWIAGGIGITPFLAWASEIVELKHPVHLFYCVRKEDEAAHLNELRALDDKPNFNLHLVCSQTSGRLTVDRIAETVDFSVSDADAYYCGPEVMRHALQKGLTARGLSRARFHYEEFEIRSGIGLRYLLSFVLRMFNRK